MSCNQECSTCKTSCMVLCPICNKNSIEVKYKAARNIVYEPQFLEKNKKVYICTNKKCEVVYFQQTNPKIYMKSELKKPVWFKEKYDNYIVCYCHNIYLDDVVKYIFNANEEKVTIEQIKKAFQKGKESCSELNPIGKDCKKLFANAIEYAYSKKKEEQNEHLA